MKVIILIGLPGSGKTSWAKEYASNNKNCKHVELDQVCIVNPIYFSFEGAIRGELKKHSNYDIVILDFIFFTNNNIAEAVNYTYGFNINEIELHYWEENREQCLINDKIRAIREGREGDCSYTINKRRFEEPDLEYFKDKYPEIKFNLCSHEVYKEVL